MTDHGMNWVDWLFIGLPILLVVFAALKSQKYVKGVADFISAGRVAGRYVLSVASGEAAQGLISVVAVLEMYYKCGFAISFWHSLVIPISMVLGLVGFCTYRFRETKALTMGQFFEIRYHKSLRVVAAIIQSISGIVNYAIFPAVGARFLMYFLDLPVYVNILGLAVPTFALCMLCALGLALLIACLGGQVTIMVTDCVQGLLSYPMYVVIVAYILYKFSWSNEMLPALMARAPGESFLNAYDCHNLRDFNVFYTLCGILSIFLGRMSWGGTMGYNGAAKSPHEAKMGALLGTWRSGLGIMIWILLAVAVFAFLNHKNYAKEAREIRYQLAVKTIDDVAGGKQFEAARAELKNVYKTIPERSKFSASYDSHEAWEAENTDPFQVETRKVLSKTEPGKKVAQTFDTIYGQMLVPLAIREMLPPYGVTGIFCALMIFLMISTDTTYMHSWGSIIVQDFVVPLRKKAFTPKGQLNALRWSIAGVAVFAFLFSLLFAQIDYILMFFAITGAIWSGAGVVITMGLYWKRGTTAGAFTALLLAAIWALSGITAQQTWAQYIYPWLESKELVMPLKMTNVTPGKDKSWVAQFKINDEVISKKTGETFAVGKREYKFVSLDAKLPKAGEKVDLNNVTAVIVPVEKGKVISDRKMEVKVNEPVGKVGQAFWNISKPLHPWIQWDPVPNKFPVNSVEIGFIGQVLALLSYMIISLLTCRRPFNMDKMLHRGIYADGEAKVVEKKPFSLARFMNKNILGIDENYTRGDKVLAWSVFCYSFIYTFVILFVVIVVWNAISPWEASAWGTYFFIKQFVVVGIIGVVSTFWFGIGGTIDLFRLFRDLDAKESNDLDDGRVVNNMSVADMQRMQEIDKERAAEENK